MKNQQQVLDFCKRNELTEEQFYGKEKYGGSLYLSSLTSIPEGFNPTVGGSLYIKGKETRIGSKVDANFFWLKDDNTRYALIDVLFCQILSERSKDEYSIYNAKEIGKKETLYIVGKDGYFAHSKESIEVAITDLTFKIASEKLKNEPITSDTIMTVQHYRLVTGACEYGCRDFMEKNNIKFEIVGDKAVVKQEVKAKDLVKLLEKSNAYGFEKFKRLLVD